MAKRGDELQKQAMRLRDAAEPQYQHFLREFATYANEVLFELRDASPVDILFTQGRAKEIDLLFKLLSGEGYVGHGKPWDGRRETAA